MKIILFILVGIIFLHYPCKANDYEICSFYLTKSKELNCSPNNYLSDFGFKYCKLFLDQESQFTSTGKQTLSFIRQCLVNEGLKASHLNCQNAKNVYQKIHFQCYRQSDFCNMKLQDISFILWFIKAELWDLTFLSTTLEILKNCFKA